MGRVFEHDQAGFFGGSCVNALAVLEWHDPIIFAKNQKYFRRSDRGNGFFRTSAAEIEARQLAGPLQSGVEQKCIDERPKNRRRG
jgi:hypothetical protein